jgi:DNA-binding transcriptional MerR regulator
MRMEKRTFRIGELAKHLNIQRFVIRFWEKEFALSPSRSIGGQRFYTQDDLDTFTLIKELLYQKGYTIAGARNALLKNAKDTPAQPALLASKKITTRVDQHATPKESSQFNKQLIILRNQLQKLYEVL